MTKFINKRSLPLPVYALTVDISTRYSDGGADISTTSLTGEPLVRILRRVYADKLVEDVISMQHRLIGSLLHNALAETSFKEMGIVPEEGMLREQRLFMDVGGWTVSGEPDYYTGYKTKTLVDYKYCAKYKTRNEIPEDWIKQLNIYAHMLRKYEREVDKLQICAWYRDAYENAGDEFTRVLPVTMYTDEQIADYILKRVKYHQVSDPNYNELIDLDGVPECSEKARYYKPPVFALMKTGRKSAVKLHDSREKAEEHKAREGGKGFWIQEREATNDKCDKYCNVAKWCQYQQARIEARGVASEEESTANDKV